MMRQATLTASLLFLISCGGSSIPEQQAIGPILLPLKVPPNTIAGIGRSSFPPTEEQPPCGCVDHDDLAIRLIEVQAVIASANKADNILPESVSFSDRLKDRMEEIWREAIAEADESSGYDTSRQPFKGANTGNFCLTRVPAMSQCMQSDALAHERVHADACVSRFATGFKDIPSRIG
jgi:hypothetical protein